MSRSGSITYLKNPRPRTSQIQVYYYELTSVQMFTEQRILIPTSVLRSWFDTELKKLYLARARAHYRLEVKNGDSYKKLYDVL
jgi:hypothetical protein